IKPDERLLVRRDVEIARENALRRSWSEMGVGLFGYFGAVLPQTQNQFVERIGCFGGHFDARKALVRSLFANIDFSNLEVRAVGQNLIQHLWQNERVDNMPA